MTYKNEKGFTLIEVLIAMALVGLVMTAVYRVYSQQVAVNNTQTIVRDMQQNIRAALYHMERELRMAGLDPSGNADAGVELAQTNRITVSADFEGGTAGDPNDFFDETITGRERVSYRLNNDIAENGGLGDGVCDNLQAGDLTPCNLVRIVGTPAAGIMAVAGNVIAENIDSVDFVFLGVDTTDTTCDNDCPIVGAVGGGPVADDRLDDIRSIQITIVARAGGASQPGFIIPYDHVRAFTAQEGSVVLAPMLANDGFRRNLLTSEISLRNMGL